MTRTEITENVRILRTHLSIKKIKKIITIFGVMYVSSILLTSCSDDKKTVSSFDTTGLPSIKIDEGWDKEQSLRVVY